MNTCGFPEKLPVEDEGSEVAAVGVIKEQYYIFIAHF
jgi:hypothetical protein